MNALSNPTRYLGETAIAPAYALMGTDNSPVHVGQALGTGRRQLFELRNQTADTTRRRRFFTVVGQAAGSSIEELPRVLASFSSPNWTP